LKYQQQSIVTAITKINIKDLPTGKDSHTHTHTHTHKGIFYPYELPSKYAYHELQINVLKYKYAKTERLFFLPKTKGHANCVLKYEKVHHHTDTQSCAK
jgi:hypothetical protein